MAIPSPQPLLNPETGNACAGRSVYSILNSQDMSLGPVTQDDVNGKFTIAHVHLIAFVNQLPAQLLKENVTSSQCVRNKKQTVPLTFVIEPDLDVIKMYLHTISFPSHGVKTFIALT